MVSVVPVPQGVQTPASVRPTEERKKPEKLMQDVHLMGLRKGRTDFSKAFPIDSESVLLSGDMVRFEFELRAKAYVYAAVLDSSEVLSVLFPAPDVPVENPLSPGKKLSIPPGKDMWFLDKVVGDETAVSLSEPVQAMVVMVTSALFAFVGKKLRNSGSVAGEVV